ncbi:MAG: HAD family hydrolase [Flavobacteriia bacterium]|jgi:putative hydrolase of the HAD superfamily
MKYSAVIFDLGGVLINLDYQKTIRAFQELGVSNFEEMYSQASQTNLFNDFETGKVSAQRFVNALLDYVPAGTSPNKIVQAWNAMILDVPLDRLKLLQQLHEKLPVFLLSNTNSLHVPIVRREWAKSTEIPMEAFFKKIYFSHEINRRKPHQEVFDFVCNEQQLDKNSTLFIDDTLQHIEGARSAGIQTFHLTNPNDLFQLFS